MTEKRLIIRNVVIGVVFIALFAQLAFDVPFGESKIPISGQTYAVLLVAYLLGALWGTIANAIYVLLGVLGVPIFAEGNSGIDVLTGGTGGYLIGFIIAAFAVGKLSEQPHAFTFSKSLIAMTIGTFIILFFGIARLAQLYSLEEALEWGFYPFIIGGVVKIILGAFTITIITNY